MSSRIHTPATRRRRTFGTGLLGAAAIAIAAFGGMLVTAAPASAHDQLVGTDPKDGATVDALPGQITLTFNEDVLPDAGATIVEVTDAAGSPVAQGEPVVSGSTVTQMLAAPADPNGSYSVDWKVVSSDGHPVSGEFAFTVTGAPITTPTATVTPSPSPSETIAPTPRAEAGGGIPTWVWAIVGVFVVALLGALVAVLVARARGAGEHV